MRSLVAAPGFADILRQRSFWGVCAGHFSVNYLTYFMLTLLPLYLVRERHLSLQSMVKVASAYYTIEALSAITTGWLSDFFLRRGHTPTLCVSPRWPAGRRSRRLRSWVACWRLLRGTCYVWLQSVSVLELAVRVHSCFPKPSPVRMRPENGRDYKTALRTSRVSWLRRSPDFCWIGPEGFWPHSRSLRQYWWLAVSLGCLWSAESNK